MQNFSKVLPYATVSPHFFLGLYPGSDPIVQLMQPSLDKPLLPLLSFVIEKGNGKKREMG